MIGLVPAMTIARSPGEPGDDVCGRMGTCSNGLEKSFLLEAEFSHHLGELCVVAGDQRAEVRSREVGGREA